MKAFNLSRRLGLCLIAPLWLGLQACAGSTAPAAGPSTPIWGTEWHLQSMGGQPVMADSEATLAFPELGKVAGNGSCNRFFGGATVEADRIHIEPLAGTKMACMPSAMAQETRYLTALQAAQRFERQGNTLIIHSEGADQTLRFVAKP